MAAGVIYTARCAVCLQRWRVTKKTTTPFTCPSCVGLRSTPMCDPAEDELGRAQDEAIDLAETKQRLAERARFDADRGLAEEREKAKAARISPLVAALPQTPAVGRIVHYVAYGTPRGEFPVGEHRAGIITAVRSNGIDAVLGVCDVCVLNPTGLFFNQNVPYDQTGQRPGAWHWPERV